METYRLIDFGMPCTDMEESNGGSVAYIYILIGKYNLICKLSTIGLSQICSKVCPKCFQEFPPNMLLSVPIMLALCL